MNITIFTIQHDDPNWLNNIKVCVGQKQLDRHLRLIMEQRLDRVMGNCDAEVADEALHITHLLEKGAVDAAWKTYTEGLGKEPVVKHSGDQYIVEGHSVSIPGLSLLREISRFSLDGELQKPDSDIRALDTIVRYARIAINEIEADKQYAQQTQTKESEGLHEQAQAEEKAEGLVVPPSQDQNAPDQAHQGIDSGPGSTTPGRADLDSQRV